VSQEHLLEAFQLNVWSLNLASKRMHVNLPDFCGIDIPGIRDREVNIAKAASNRLYRKLSDSES